MLLESDASPLAKPESRCSISVRAAALLRPATDSESTSTSETLPLPQWHGWHAFRRGLATNLHALGVDDETIERILRHSNVSITQKCYIKTMPAQATDAMAQFGAEVLKTQRIQ